MAEIAFSVVKDWQGRGLSLTVIIELAEAARRNGIKGLTAYTSRENKRMVKLFNTLDYEVKTTAQGSSIYFEASFTTSKDTTQVT